MLNFYSGSGAEQLLAFLQDKIPVLKQQLGWEM